MSFKMRLKLLKYESVNSKQVIDNIDQSTFLFENNNNLFYYFVQRNLKHGKKLKYCSIIFNVLRLLQQFNQYGHYKSKLSFRYNAGFSFKNLLISRYIKYLPNFALRLENEYKGKHKTKRKFMYSVFLENFKSQINELSLWFKKISFKYNYRDFSVRLSILFFNYIFFLHSKLNKLNILNNKIFLMQKGGGKTFITSDKTQRDFLLSDEYKKTMQRLTFARLKIKLKPKIDLYYKTLFFKYKDDLGYVARHSIGKVRVEKYLKIFYKNKLITKEQMESGKQMYYGNV